jgi:CBS domain-containing protein
VKVKEIMKRQLVSLKPEDNVIEALNLLFKMQISGLPVIDNQGKLVGMFTEKDVLSRLLPSYIEKVGRFVYEDNPKATKNKFVELSKMKVKDVMRQEVVTATEDASLCEVAKDMLTQGARRIPIVDRAGKVVGIVARCDILRALAKEAEIYLHNNK